MAPDVLLPPQKMSFNCPTVRRVDKQWHFKHFTNRAIRPQCWLPLLTDTGCFRPCSVKCPISQQEGKFSWWLVASEYFMEIMLLIRVMEKVRCWAQLHLLKMPSNTTAKFKVPSFILCFWSWVHNLTRAKTPRASGALKGEGGGRACVAPLRVLRQQISATFALLASLPFLPFIPWPPFSASSTKIAARLPQEWERSRVPQTVWFLVVVGILTIWLTSH